MAEIKLTGRIVKVVQNPLPAGNVEDTYVVIEKRAQGRVFLIPINQEAPLTVKCMDAVELLEQLLAGSIEQAGSAIFDDVMSLLGGEE